MTNPAIADRVLYQVTAPHFCAAVVVEHSGVIRDTAPILRWAHGRQIEWLRRYVQRKRWRLISVGSCR